MWSWPTPSSPRTRRASSMPCSIAWPGRCGPGARLAPARRERVARAMAEGEFEFIARRLRPLAAGTPGALRLLDDAALLDPPEGAQLVLTKDAMVAGVHFLADDPAAQIGQKLLRVNLSDLAAMGAEPIGYLLALARPG